MTNVQTETRREFIVLVALLTAMVAMSIDSMLPALEAMASGFGVNQPNLRQFIITVFFAGLTIGTLFYGPISDSTGRKPAIYAGLGIFVAGTLICFFSSSFEMLLIGRALQGLGAAGPRIVALAMVRDGLSGAAMARVMSFVMSVFMIVPILAPSIGQLVLLWASWRFIFLGLLGMAAIAASLLYFRQDETLPPSRRRPFSIANLAAAAREFFRYPVAWGYTLATGFIFASFISYLGMSQQIFVEIYGQGKLFSVWFGFFAVGIALAMLLNARLVMRLGLRRLSRIAIFVAFGAALVFSIVTYAYNGAPPLWSLGCYLFLTFFCSGALFGNFGALAMEPVGRIAGMAAALNGSLSSLIAILMGGYIGQAYDGTVKPLVYGFLATTFLALVVTEAVQATRKR